MTDYRTYKISAQENLILMGSWIFICGIVAYLFYRSIIPFIFLAVFFPYFKKWAGSFLKKRRDSQICSQFKDAITTLSTSMETGASLENAVWDAYLQVCVIYSRNAFMALELLAISNKLKMSVPVETAFGELSERTDIEDIVTFCDIIKIAKRTDGNLIDIIRSTAGTMADKFEIRRDIALNIRGRQMEQIILCAMPIGIFIYMSATTPGFFTPIYHNLAGILFSTACLLLYAAAVALSVKISRIEP